MIIKKKEEKLGLTLTN